MQSRSAVKMKNLVIISCFIMAICQIDALAPNKVDCESLDLNRTLLELVQMAKFNKSTLNEAQAIFKCNYFETRFVVRVLEDVVHNRKSLSFHTLGPNNIQILNSNFLLDFVRLFSIHMHAFTFDLQHTPVQLCRNVLRLIRIRSESLVHLELLNARGTELSESDTAFKTVRSLSVSGQWIKWGANNLNFAQLFPNLRRLDFKTQGFSIENQEQIAQVYPTLEHLHISFAQRGGGAQEGVFSERVVADLLKLNPSIQSLALDYCSESFLNQINSALPNLESLRLTDLHEIDNQPYNGDSIVMGNVRNLEMVSQRTSRRVLQKTTFPKLIELSLELNAVVKDELNLWMDFVSNHKKIVALKVLGIVRDAHLTQFGRDLPELKQIVVKADRAMKTQTIVDFVNESGPLIVLDLKSVHNLAGHRAALEGQFSDEWRIETPEERRLTIRRRM